MSVRRTKDLTFSPEGLSDAIDGTHVFRGACSSLSNLIPAVHTKGLWVPRPAAEQLTDFTGVTTPGFVSCMKVLGNRVYGLISSALNAGKDEPFCYNISTGAFEAVTGITSANVPTSPSSSGDWTPPTMDLIGVYLVVTHPGYTGGGGNFFGWFDLTTVGSPVWHAGNVSTSGAGIALTSVPVAVANFNGRAHFAQAEFDVVTDPLTLNVSDASHVLSFEDNISVTAFKTISLQNQNGGIVQALIVFKGASHPYQIKGDFVTNDLTIDAMNNSIGTQASLSLVDTPYGVALVAPDGLRIIDITGKFSDPIGIYGDGVNQPFVSALVPSRVVAACNGNVLRIATQNASRSGSPFEEYWWHLASKKWSGPHTFVPSLVAAYMNKFIIAPQAITGKLFTSEVIPSTTSVYTENGAQLNWVFTPVFLPDDGRVGIFALGETTINMALDPGMNSWTATAQNANNVLYDSVANAVSGTTPIWDSAIWDADVWDGTATGLIPRQVIWSTPVVSSRAQLSFVGGSAPGVILGDIKYAMEELPFIPQDGV